MPVSLPALFRSSLDRWFLLHGAEAQAEALPAGRRATITAFHEAARTRVEAALGDHGVPALLLVRAAIPLYLRAAVTARGPGAPADDAKESALWESYDERAATGMLPDVPEELAPARVHAEQGLSADAEIAEHGDGRIDEALALADFLADGIELRTPFAIRMQRRLRKTALGLAVVLLAVEAFLHRPKPPSLALHANVVSSSRRPGSGPPQDLTNGKVEPTFAFATKDEADPWVMIDIGPSTRVGEVTLVNSDDHLDDSLPVRIETSSDGATWDPAATVTAHFSPGAPAVASFTTRSARFIRVHGKPSGALYLTEVEVR